MRFLPAKALEDDRDPRSFGIPDPAELTDGVFAKCPPNMFRRVNTREYFIRWISGAVFPDERVEFPFGEIEAHAVSALRLETFTICLISSKGITNLWKTESVKVL